MNILLKEILEYLNTCGIEAEYKTERVEPSVNVGDVKHVKNRMQFWVPKNSKEIHLFVGKEMGKLFVESGKSVYLNPNYRYSDKENKVEFHNIDVAIEFRKRVSIQ